MLDKAQLETHRTWQEAAGMGLGLIAALSPWITGQTANPTILAATAAAGSLVLLISAAQLLSLTRFEEVATLLAGLWLWAAPFTLGYIGSPLGVLHLLLGPAIAALAALELWQDWAKSDDELERYGS